MFEIAGQSPAGTVESARFNAADSDTSRQPSRRYTAQDFRALMARVSRGPAAAPPRHRPAAMPDVVPQPAASDNPAAAHEETEHLAETEVPETKIPETEAVAADEALATEAELDDSLPVEQLAQDDDFSEADEMLDVVEVADVAETVEVADFDDSLPAEPLAQDDAFSEADEMLDVVEAADMAEMAEIADFGDSLPVEPLAQEDALSEADETLDLVEAADMAEMAEIADFDETAPEADDGGIAAAEPAEDSNAVVDPELQSAETARTLLDIMAMPSGVQPQERALAGDTLLRLVSRMPVASLIGLCDRLCIMDAPPPLLVRRLINHDNVDVAGPLLERCPGISDQDLMTIINRGDVVILRLIARRRHLSPALTDALLRHGDASVTTAMVRNPCAALSHETFSLLAETAKTRTSLQAPLATRADTPAPIAFELFWILPPQLRRYVLSRFLTESANLDRILKIAQTLDGANGEAAGSPRIADKTECDGLVALIAEGKTTEAARKLADMAGICEANAQRIIGDSEGEPLTVAMKAIGMSRTQSAAAAEILRDAPEAPLRSNRRIAELQNLFDSLSFTKARVLLTYWDWAVEQSGPYSGKAG